jgi:hypothetical protein
MSELGSLDVEVWLACAYTGFLLLAAYGLDRLGAAASRRSGGWRHGAFRYHADHDAWVCPQDQWLWPHSFDPDQRVLRYRASPTVCNSCPVKHTCTTSDSGREVSRPVDPWPHSEAGRFQRGIACALTGIAVLLPLALAVGQEGLAVGVLLGAAVLAAALSLPLWRHLRRTPSGFPEHVAVRPSVRREPDPTAGADRYATRWGGFGKPDSAGGTRRGTMPS